MDFYKAIMGDAGKYLKPGGYVALEMNSAKSYEIQEIIIGAGFTIDKVIKDYAGLERIVVAKKDKIIFCKVSLIPYHLPFHRGNQMDKIVIYGGKRLKGTVRISGSKNAALPILVASLLTDEECIVNNVPDLTDIDTTNGFIGYIGKKVERSGNRVVIKADGKLKASAPYDLVRKMRASVLVMGALLGRLGHVKVSLPGGCAIGARPIDIHLDGFEKLGADILFGRRIC